MSQAYNKIATITWIRFITGLLQRVCNNLHRVLRFLINNG